MPIQPADPALRRQALIAVTLAAVLGSAALLGLQHWLTDLQARPAREELQGLLSALRGCTFSMCGLLVGLAFYSWRLARRVTRDQRFPPLGRRVLRDTPVLEGAAALNRARILRMLAVILVLSSLGLMMAVARLTATFGGSLPN